MTIATTPTAVRNNFIATFIVEDEVKVISLYANYKHAERVAISTAKSLFNWTDQIQLQDICEI